MSGIYPAIMTPPYPRWLRLSLFLAAAPFAAGQTTPAAVPPPVPVSAAATEETLKLNPFVVSEDDNVGYAATSTLAGTRINTAQIGRAHV